jgi:hypothetical protein
MVGLRATRRRILSDSGVGNCLPTLRRDGVTPFLPGVYACGYAALGRPTVNRNTSPRLPRIFRATSFFVCGLVFSVVGIEWALEWCGEGLAPPNLPEERLPLSVNGVRVVMGLQLWTTDPAGRLRAELPDSEDVEVVLPLIEKALSEYPQSLIGKIRMTKVMVCKNLEWDGEQFLGLAKIDESSMYIDAKGSLGKVDYLVSAIHHELFHFVDYELSLETANDQTWESLNHQGFAYAPGPLGARRIRHTTAPDASLAGFVNKYSTFGPKEDKAEVFSFMMSRPDYVRLRMESDSILRLKVAEMKKRICRFCAEMSDAFWDKKSL